MSGTRTCCRVRCFLLLLPAIEAALFVLVALAATPVQAAYGGRNFFIERPRLAIDLSYRMETEERQAPFNSFDNEVQIFAQRFDIETAGWIYHPALMTYTLRLSPEFRQTQEAYDPGVDRSENSTLAGYDARLNFLESKPYSVYLFANRQETTVTSSLATTTDTLSDSYGATLRLKNKALPTMFSLLHVELEQRGFYVWDETRDEARLNMRHRRPRSETVFDLSWSDRSRDTLGTSPSTSNSENVFGTLNNQFRITQDNRILLSSVLSFRQSENSISTLLDNFGFSQTGYMLSETLNWRHTKTFSTNYNLMLTRDEFEFQTLDRVSGSAGLSHSLYENLVTTATVNASDSSSGESDYGGNLNFAYQRRIPGGTIFADIGQGYRVNNRADNLGFITVIDESHILTTGDVTLLDNTGVDLASVVVTSADRSIIYVRDIDYTLEVIGISVRISRTTFGAIAEGDTVLVSYRFLASDYDSSDHTQTYRIGFHLWDAWRINYRYVSLDEDFIAGTPPAVLNEETRHLVDSELIWRWSTTRFLYEDLDSTTGLSLSRWRIEETLAFRPGNTFHLSLSGFLGNTEFKDIDGSEDFFGFRANAQWRVNNWSRAQVEAFYSDVDGTSVVTQTQGVGARWEWFYGIWGGDVQYRFFNEEDLRAGQTRDRHSFYVSVRRSLF